MSTGDVTVRLFKGSAMPVARTSRYSLYREDLATFEEDSVYDQADAGGFVRLWGLPSSLAARVRARAASGDRDWAASASVETVRSSAKPMQRPGRAAASGSR